MSGFRESGGGGKPGERVWLLLDQGSREPGITFIRVEAILMINDGLETMKTALLSGRLLAMVGRRGLVIGRS
jgi:hypothetical protein